MREYRKRPGVREKIRAANLAYTRTPEGRAKNVVWRRTTRYGVTGEQQRAIFDAQGGRCGNSRCAAPLDFASAHLDHDHATGAVRAFLCRGCNTAVGNLGESPDRARGLADYLERVKLRATG